MFWLTLISIVVCVWSLHVVLDAIELRRKLNEQAEWERLMDELDRIARGGG
jgi:hypothetical protein